MTRPVETLPDAFPAARFRRLDGHAELAVAEAASAPRARPARVTAVLAALCVDLGGAPADAAAARRVSSAGREWLLSRAALRFGAERDWFEAPCEACGARFDVQVAMAEAPRTPPSSGFPVAEVETSLGRRRFESPNGMHEEVFARRREGDPRRVFAALCGLSREAEAEAIRFEPADLARIDAGLEAVSPEIADGVDVVCPECGGAGRVRIDPLAFAFPSPEDVLREVHLLAAAYRWSEEAILDLPVARRRAYAGLVRADRRNGFPGRLS